MSTITKQCERDGCNGTVRYGVETRAEVIPKYCSFKCRDMAEFGWDGQGYSA